MTNRGSFTIRPARRQDRWLIVRRILREGLDPTRLDWRRFVVAEGEEGAVLGFAQMKDLGQGVEEFGSLIVEPSARGQGIGGALLRHLVEPALKPVYLMCAGHNIDYYERFDFRTIEEAEMPKSLRRKWRIGTSFARLFGKQVAVMGRFV